MDERVVDFLKSTKISYREFDRLLSFFQLKNDLIYKQNFLEVCNSVSKYLKDNLHAVNIKISTYDIEYAQETTVYLNGDDFDPTKTPNVISFDFSKSYTLNGRLYFTIDSKVHYNLLLKEDENFLEYMFFEFKAILSTYLALEKMQEACYIDEVTGLENRRFLINHMESLLPVVQKESIKLALLKIEIDRLKAVVEEFNYEISQQVLKKLANVLKENVQGTNIVTKFEGDTFLVLMQDVDSEDEITTLAQKIIDDFAKQSVTVNAKTGQKLQKTICAGIVQYPQDGTTLNTLFSNVDIALDEAKNKGRSSFEFYKEEQNSALDLF